MSSLLILPTPSSLSYSWNFGSLLGVCLLIQMMSGIFLAMHYVSSVEEAFNSINHIAKNVNNGWLISVIHSNGASLFFACAYVHVGSSLYYGGYKNYKVWISGLVLILLMFAMAFLGYVLPWGQMSFWGATVITNFFSAVPFMGESLVLWLWGGFSVGQATLGSFYSLHYLLPFLLAGGVMMHVLLLHSKGSTNPMMGARQMEKVPFLPYFTSKDLYGLMLFLMMLVSLVCFNPYLLGESENFMKANPLVTPTHMVPEWYFLFAYAMLSACPHKLGGLMGLMLALLVFLVLPWIYSSKVQNCAFKPLSSSLFWVFVANFMFLTWLGAQPVMWPFMKMSAISSVVYFFSLIMLPIYLTFLEELVLFGHTES